MSAPSSPGAALDAGSSRAGLPDGLARELLAALDQAVCVSDMRQPGQPIVFVNDAFTRTTGYRPRDVLGRNCRFLNEGLHPGTRRVSPQQARAVAAAVEEIRALLADGRAGVVTLLNERAGGGLFTNELSLSPLRDADGRVTHYVAVQRDISEQVAVRAARRALQGELAETGHALQQALVPRDLPTVPGWRTAVRYLPASRHDLSLGSVSGDFYDVFAGPSGPAGPWFAVLGDVSGRGPQAAATTSALRWSLRGAATTEHTPAALLRAVGEAVHGQLGERFATVAAVGLRPVLPVQAGCRPPVAEVLLALAGHPRPVLLPEDGEPRPVGVPGDLVGPFADLTARDEPVALGPGDQLVLYTDGVTEAAAPDGRLLDEAGLLRALAALPVSSRRAPDAPEHTADAIVQAVRRHAGPGPLDDLTLLVLGRR